MSRLPKGWAVAAIGEIADINPRHPRDLEDSLSVTFVRMPALSEVSSKFDSTEERSLGEVRKGFTHFAEGDVLFAKITPCMENGKAGVATNLINGIGCGTTELHVMRPLGGIDSKYLFHFVHREAFREEAARNFTGTAGQLRVPVSFVRDAEIPLPPLNEQRRIVAKLETLLSRVDAAQERLATIPRILKRFRQSVLAAACSGVLTADWRTSQLKIETGAELRSRILNDRYLRWIETNRTHKTAQYKQPATADETSFPGLPNTWARMTIEALLRDDSSLSYGILKPGLYDPSGIPMLRVMDVGDGKLNDTEIFRVTPSLAEEYKRTRLEANDVLLAVMATIGRSMVVPSHLIGANVNRALAVLKLTELLDSNFACMVIRSPHFQDVFAAEKIGSAQLRINLGDLRQFTFPLPPYREQQEIVHRVNALFKTADVLEARYRKAKEHVDKLTVSILAKAFRGELVTQDPDDEPASDLLKRIRSSDTMNSGTRKRTYRPGAN